MHAFWPVEEIAELAGGPTGCGEVARGGRSFTRRFSVARSAVDRVWNVMVQAQKPDFVFRRNGRVHLNRRGHQFSRLLTAEVCASAIVMLDTPCSEVVWRVLATHSIRQFPLHFPSRASPCAITFQLDCTAKWKYNGNWRLCYTTLKMEAQRYSQTSENVEVSTRGHIWEK